MSQYLITYDLTMEADDMDKAIDDANKVLYTGEEHTDDVHLVDWVRSVEVAKL